MHHKVFLHTALAALAIVFIFAGTPVLAASSYTNIYNFQPETSTPLGPLVADSAGNFYGVAAGPGAETGSNTGIVFELSPPAKKGGSWTVTTIFTFNGTSDGNSPQSGLAIDSKGNLYGTTYDGGSGTCLLGNSNIGCGLIYELSQSGGSWSETVLYNFQGGKDGRNPNLAPLTFDAEGNLYGVTNLGGGSGCSATLKVGCGVLFKLTPPAEGGASWTEKVLHRFAKKTGTYPYGNLLYLNGNLYGTTSGGGADGYGTAYESTVKGKVTVINNFTGASGGYNPAGLAADASGNLYGFALSGGPANYGLVYELTPSGTSWTENVLYNFTGHGDGGTPVGAPILDSSGNIYGNTQAGGDIFDCTYTEQQDGCGVVFEVANSGGKISESVIHTFTGGTTASTADGSFPSAGLIFGGDGTLYGITQTGGSGECVDEKGTDLGCGIAFSVTP
ncbi:MAG: choice-of-anchor tandem repeat GloVer-containing protein [Terriglobales bacterium]